MPVAEMGESVRVRWVFRNDHDHIGTVGLWQDGVLSESFKHMRVPTEMLHFYPCSNAASELVQESTQDDAPL